MTTDAPVIPEGYEAFLRDIKKRIQKAQLRASLSVNRELVLLYWKIGKDILERQRALEWDRNAPPGALIEKWALLI